MYEVHFREVSHPFSSKSFSLQFVVRAKQHRLFRVLLLLGADGAHAWPTRLLLHGRRRRVGRCLLVVKVVVAVAPGASLRTAAYAIPFLVLILTMYFKYSIKVLVDAFSKHI
jgi:hypothetical protein